MLLLGVVWKDNPSFIISIDRLLRLLVIALGTSISRIADWSCNREIVRLVLRQSLWLEIHHCYRHGTNSL